MGMIFDSLFSKFRERNNQTAQEYDYMQKTEYKLYIQKAEHVSSIVDKNTAQGMYSAMNLQLSELTNTFNERTKYVFPGIGRGNMFIMIAILAIIEVVAIYLFMLGIGTVLFSQDLKKDGINYTLVAAAFIVINTAFIIKLVKEVRFNSRYEKYYNVLRFKGIEPLNELASITKEKEGTVVKDLLKAVRMKLIPQGQFGTDNIIFIVSGDIYEMYQKMRGVYDEYFGNLSKDSIDNESPNVEVQSILNQGMYYIDMIHDSNKVIKNKGVSEKLDRMEKLVSVLFHEVKRNPEMANEIGMIIRYYLSTVNKLLEAYIENEKSNINGVALKNNRQEIETALDIINVAFETLFKNYFQEQELFTYTDIVKLDS